MKLSLIGIGIFFLLNPVVGVYDVLPDFIGCFLIILGIRDAAYMIEKLESARRFFVYSAWLSLFRFAVSFMGVERQHTLPLTLAFTFAVAELILYIPAIKNLFDGLDFAAMRHGGSGIFSGGQKQGFYYDENGVKQYGEIGDDSTGKLARTLICFTVIRAVFSVIPELPALQLSESEGLGDVGAFRFDSIGTLIKTVCVSVVLIPAVITFVKSVRFLRRAAKAGDFIPSVYSELHSRFGDLSELHISSRMKTVSLISCGAVLLYMGFYDYQMNIIPRYVPALLLAAAAVVAVFSGMRAKGILPVLLGAFAVPLSVVTSSLQREHYGLYKLQMMDMFDSGAEYIPDRNINAIDEEYLRMAFFESAEAALLGVGIVLFAVFYMRLCLRHTAELSSVPERDRVPLSKSLKIRGGLMIAGVALSTLYFTAYRFVLPYFDAAPIVGVGVNVLAFALCVSFALQSNQYVYGNNYEI